jgi:cysteine synthase A
MFIGSVLDTIGKTPAVKLQRIGDIYVKMESRNPGGSVKDRAALSMIRNAESRGSLKSGKIVEATSGNTGIGLAMVSAALGYKLTIVMPDSMTRERAEIMRAYGAEVIFTPGTEGMKGAVDKAAEIAKEYDAFMPAQFSNPSNVMAHYVGTAKEILEDVPDIDIIVAGIGTGGTATGIGKAMKNFAPNVKVIGVEPLESALITTGKAGSHGIQGIGSNFIPDLLDMDVIDSIVTVKSDDAKAMARRLAREEGILAGISSGAAVHAALSLAKDGKKVLAILPDSGERYISTGIFE